MYQALYRLEERGLVAAQWGVTEQNRRARFYEITVAGVALLEEQTAWWLRYSDVVTALLTRAPQAG